MSVIQHLHSLRIYFCMGMIYTTGIWATERNRYEMNVPDKILHCSKMVLFRVNPRLKGNTLLLDEVSCTDVTISFTRKKMTLERAFFKKEDLPGFFKDQPICNVKIFRNRKYIYFYTKKEFYKKDKKKELVTYKEPILYCSTLFEEEKDLEDFIHYFHTSCNCKFPEDCIDHSFEKDILYKVAHDDCFSFISLSREASVAELKKSIQKDYAPIRLLTLGDMHLTSGEKELHDHDILVELKDDEILKDRLVNDIVFVRVGVIDWSIHYLYGLTGLFCTGIFLLYYQGESTIKKEEKDDSENDKSIE